jgi:hypothetical protein
MDDFAETSRKVHEAAVLRHVLGEEMLICATATYHHVTKRHDDVLNVK